MRLCSEDHSMRRNHIAGLAIAAASITFGIATPVLAGSPYYDAQEAAPMMRPSARPVAQRQQGHFTCSYNERRTRLERKNCGGQRY